MSQSREPVRGVASDPYPSGIYSTLPYPPAAAVPPPPASLTAPMAAAPGRRPGQVEKSAAHRPAVRADHTATPAGGSVAPTPAVLAHIGDIDVTATCLCTPVGEVTLATAVVAVADDYEVRTPTWAMVCAIVGFFVVPVVSLAFLLAAETVPTGHLWVTVSGGNVHHETLVTDPAEIDLARSLAASDPQS